MQSTNVKGVFREINKLALVVDASYQKGVSASFVKKLTHPDGTVNWAAFGALTVKQRRDGSLAVIDGQHRLLAVRDLPSVTTVPCMVYPSESVEDEAQDFLSINQQRRGINRFDKLKARVVAGDPAAILCRDLIMAAERDPGPTGRTSEVVAIDTLYRVCARRPEAIKRVWPVIVAASLDTTIRAELIKGLSWLEAHGMSIGDSLSKPGTARKIIKIGGPRLADMAVEHLRTYSKHGDHALGEAMSLAIFGGARPVGEE